MYGIQQQYFMVHASSGALIWHWILCIKMSLLKVEKTSVSVWFLGSSSTELCSTRFKKDWGGIHFMCIKVYTPFFCCISPKYWWTIALFDWEHVKKCKRPEAVPTAVVFHRKETVSSALQAEYTAAGVCVWGCMSTHTSTQGHTHIPPQGLLCSTVFILCYCSR